MKFNNMCERILNEKMETNELTSFLQEYFIFVNNCDLYHWITKKRNVHKEIEAIKGEISELFDAFVEPYQGKYGRMEFGYIELTLPNKSDINIKKPDVFVQHYIDFLNESKGFLMNQDPELIAVIDDMIAALEKCKYLLTFSEK